MGGGHLSMFSLFILPRRGRTEVGVGHVTARSATLTFPLRGKVRMGVGYAKPAISIL